MNGISLVEHDFLNFLHFWNSLTEYEYVKYTVYRHALWQTKGLENYLIMTFGL